MTLCAIKRFYRFAHGIFVSVCHISHIGNDKWINFEVTMKKWTTAELLAALQAQGVNVELHGEVILATMEEYGDLMI